MTPYHLIGICVLRIKKSSNKASMCCGWYFLHYSFVGFPEYLTPKEVREHEAPGIEASDGENVNSR
jgi:hypothetical protein